MKMQIAKGVRDTNPEEKILKLKIENTLRETFELYGYNPLDTPTIERFDVLSSKYAGGAEILKETFKLNDQGKRDLCLRYDLTVPFARYISMNPTLKMPFKRYQIGSVFRDGPIKLGRYREFIQCDVDVVGIKNVFAEAELLKLASQALKNLGLETVIKVNNRKLLDGIVKEAGVSEDKVVDVILTIDKLKKLSESELKKEFAQKEISEEAVEKIFSLALCKGNNSEKLEFLKNNISNDLGLEGINELESLFNYLKIMKADFEFDPSLARGLAYYTGTVYEIFMKESKVTSSISAGGRYDNMIKNFIGNNQEYPAVGISFGLDVIFEAMKITEKEKKQSVVKAYIIPINTLNESIDLLMYFRENGIQADINTTKKGISKALDYASSYSIPYTIFVGETELAQKKFKLKNMVSGEEKMLSKDEIISLLKE